VEQARLTLRFLAFSLWALAVYLLLLAVIPERSATRVFPNLTVRAGGYGHSLTRLQDARQHGPCDILVLGSSHAYRGLDPRVFAEHDLDLFNLGSSSQSPVQTEMLVRRYVDRLTPRLVLIETYPRVVALDGVESALDLLANSDPDRHSLAMVWRVCHIRAWNGLAYGFVRQWKGVTPPQEPRQRGMDNYVDGGFVERRMAGNRPPQAVPPAGMTLRDMQLRALERTIGLLKDRGIPVVLLEAPVTSADRRAAIGREAVVEQLRVLAPYLDTQDLVQLDDEADFYDSHHLNQRGVVRFNKALIERLRSDGLLPL
jgi:hypothetical protein